MGNPEDRTQSQPTPATLKRTVGFGFLVLYGLGTIVGAGFYALTGKVAAVSGINAPLAFLLAGLLALLTGLSYAELSSRFPHSAGSARYVEAAFGGNSLAAVTGWLIICTGIVSAATLCVATIGFLQDLINAPYVLSLAALVVIITVVAVVSISEAVSAVVIITVIEVGALVYICLVKGDVVLASPERLVDVFIPTGIPAWSGICVAAFLAFYAFIGFEDMVTLAEEVKDARRAVPRAIITCILCTLVIYAAVATIAVLAVEPEALANARTPLALVIADEGWFSRVGIGIVSILTGINGALVQVIMAARVVYGMSKRRQAPVWLGAINPRTRTPIRASLLAGAVILGLALTFDLATLAKITSAIILVIFAMVNLSLLIINRDQAAPLGVIAVPKSVPLLGALACTALLLFQAWNLTV